MALNLVRGERAGGSTGEAKGRHARIVYDRDPRKMSMDHGDGYISGLSGKVLVFPEDHAGDFEMEDAVEAGFFEASIVHAGEACNDGVSLLMIMDDHSQEMLSIYEAMFGTEERVRKMEEKEEIFDYEDILVVDRIAIRPEFRGQGLGLAVLWHLMKWHGPGATAMIVNPGQAFIDEKDDVKEFKKMHLEAFRGVSEKTGARKLKRHFAKLGFSSIGDGVMVASGKLVQPIPEEIFPWIGSYYARDIIARRNRRRMAAKGGVE